MYGESLGVGRQEPCRHRVRPAEGAAQGREAMRTLVRRLRVIERVPERMAELTPQVPAGR